MKMIAILGANGRLANEAMQAFNNAAYKVIAVTRSGEVRDCPAGVETRAADAMDAEQLIQATEGADFIFNGLNPLYTKWDKMALPLAKNALKAAKAHGAVHLFPGNVYNYGKSIPPHCDETTPFSADTKKGKIREQMEKLFANEGDVKTVVLRAGDFYGGAGTGSWFDLSIVSKLSKGAFTYPGGLDVPHSWAYLPDLASAFVGVANRTESLPNFSQFMFAGHVMTGNEMKAHIEKATHRTLKTTGVPWLLLRIIGFVVPMLREVCEVAYLWDKPHRLDGTKLKDLVMPLQETPVEVAIKKSIEQLGFKG
ncbi:MAG: NAD(P)H-binding protein [Leucothrix sp.]